MAVSSRKIHSGDVVKASKPKSQPKCVSCGRDVVRPRRRYCSPQCRQHTMWVLSLSKGLLRAFNARYAAFSFTRDYVVLDVLPVWSKGISRFVSSRTPGKKPAEDLKSLVLRWGERWHKMVDGNKSRSYASLHLLEKNHKKGLDPETIKPPLRARLKLSKSENDCIRILRLDRQDLSSKGHVTKIKSAYRKMAKRYHPDMGGDEEKFKELNEAHTQMLEWAENPPLYTSRRALRNSWSYDGATNRWSPPL